MQDILQKKKRRDRKALLSCGIGKESILFAINKEMYAGCQNTLSANGLSIKV